MNETVKRLLDANREYECSGTFIGDVSAKRREENAAGQKPYAVIITCSDSRVVPEAIFSAGIGELFVIRTAGNVIGDSELASLAYAVDHLHADTVVVLGHTRCGAVHAALCGEFEGVVGMITKRIKQAIGGETDAYKACVLNVKDGVRTIKKEIGREDVTVAGAVYDIVTGKVLLTD
ncbi:MAG: carbonate dehydratase [Erysipelotrichales bacterium]|nr:carbonate dehydratase [Erysipelotrichales bacterium]MBQ4375417.1 carbonate dehydratase [Erysipelotrichales bacterium]MBQ5542406.1 carbonate dehydratase [Erysipelotrichales bacterium]